MTADTLKSLYIDFSHNNFSLLYVWDDFVDECSVTSVVVDLCPLEKLSVCEGAVEFLFGEEVVEITPFPFSAGARRGRPWKVELGMAFPQALQDDALAYSTWPDNQHEFSVVLRSHRRILPQGGRVVQQ